MTSFAVIEGSTHFCFSHLQKNRKVREMIATAHNFIVSFVEQRASPVWPGTVESTPTKNPKSANKWLKGGF